MAATCTCCGQSGGETVQLHSRRDIKTCYRCLDWLNATRDRHVKAHGGGWTVAGFEPISTVSGVERALDHYQKMGFDTSHHDETYAFAHRDKDLTIHLVLAVAGDPPTTGSLYIHWHDADQVADEWRKAGLKVNGPKDKDYGKREGSHIDPDGNIIRFGSPLRRPD